MKKIILLSTLVILGSLALSQITYAANANLSMSPAAASKNVGVVFNVAVKIDPQGNKVCVIQGTLNFNNLSCQSITVASGVMAQTAPTCASPSFMIGIPKCATAPQNIFSVSVKGIQAGKGSLSITGVDVIGVGVDVPSIAQDGAYNITKVPVPTPKSTTTPAPTVCTPNWQTGEWGTCIDSQQTRTVTDLNNCGATTDEPDTVQTCQPPALFDIAAKPVLPAKQSMIPLVIFSVGAAILIILFFIFLIAKRRKKKEGPKK